MLPEQFIFLAVAFNTAGTFGYLRATLRGETIPNRVTWSLWAAAPLIAFAAQIDEGVGLAALMTFMVGFNPLLIFLASFKSKTGKWNLTRLDIVCGALSVIGLVLWQISGSATLAIVFSILADFLAGVPTVRKAFTYPETENALVFWGALLSALITMATLDRFDFATLGFPLYIAAICLLLGVLIQFPRLGRSPVST